MATLIKQIPVIWGEQNEYSESQGVLQIDNPPEGAIINATWGQISGEGRSCGNYTWYYFSVNCSIKQYGLSTLKNIYKDGYYKPSTYYSYEFDLDIPFSNIKSEQPLDNNYEVILKDNQQLFANSSWRFNEVQLVVNSVRLESIKNVQFSSNKIYDNIIVTYDLDSPQNVYYIVKQGSKTILSGTSTLNTFTIPKGTIQNAGTISVEIHGEQSWLGEVFSSSTVRENFNVLSVEKPTNFRLMAEKVIIEQDSLFKWDTIDSRCKAKMEIWQEGECVLVVNNITGNQYILKGGTLTKTSPLTLRVRTIIDNDGYFLESAYTELKQTTLESIKPVITDFTLESNNVDYDITITSASTNCESYQVKLGNEIIANSLTIPKDTLTAGLNEITLVGINGSILDTLTKSFTLIQDESIIHSIEPNNINVNVNMLSTISFTTNEFIDTFELFINGSRFTSGTTQREFVIAGGTFTKGTNKIKVIATYRDSRTTTKEVEFTGYGKPNIPILNIQEMYGIANPVFYWVADSQIAYEIIIGEVEHEVVNTNISEHTTIEPLENHTTYTLKLRTKNEYELWSDWAEATFQTLYADIAKPELVLSAQAGGNVLLQVSCALVELREMCIYKWNYNSKSWIEYANDLRGTDDLIDYLVQPNREEKYKARVYDTNGAYNESEIQTITINNIKNYNLVDVLDITKNHRLDFVSINFNHMSNSISKVFAGQSKPRVFKGGTSYYTGSMTVKMVNEEAEEFIDYVQGGSNIFCYRDYKGKKMYVSIDLTAINYINPFMQEIILTLTEVNFNEYLAGNKAKSADFIYLDGQYYLDGSIDLRGWK